jgi:hypothetical protein
MNADSDVPLVVQALPVYAQLVNFCVKFNAALASQQGNLSELLQQAQQVSQHVLQAVNLVTDSEFAGMFQTALQNQRESHQQLMQKAHQQGTEVVPNAKQMLDLHFTTGDIGVHIGLMLEAAVGQTYNVPGASHSVLEHGAQVVQLLADWQVDIESTLQEYSALLNASSSIPQDQAAVRRFNEEVTEV